MPGTLVSNRSLISTNPRSDSLTPASLRPTFSMFGARPAATSTFSTSSVRLSPPLSTVIVTPAVPTFTFEILAPTTTSIPRLRKLFITSAEQSASSIGRMRGATSSRVTLVPYALNTSENSHPTAPAPITAIVLGAVSRTSTSSLESTVALSSSRPICGSPRTREPVATTRARFASCRSVFPSAPVTSTAFGDATFALPFRYVTLFFLNRNSTPLEFCVLTARERFIAGP